MVDQKALDITGNAIARAKESWNENITFFLKHRNIGYILKIVKKKFPIVNTSIFAPLLA